MFDELLTDADRQYLRRVEEFCREKVDPNCAKWDEDESLPREIFTDAGRLGLLGMTAPTELGGRRADVLVVMARSGQPQRVNGDARPEISAFVVTAQYRQVIRKIPTYGIKSSDTAEIRFDRAPAELLGQRGKGRENALSLLDRGRIGIAALAVGIARAARDEAAAYSLRRKQFSRPIADFQAVQWMLADSTAELEAAELLVLKAAALEDAGRSSPRAASIAKLFASEAATRICNRAVQVLGGRGVSRDYPVERYLRDAKICEIVEGTSEVQRLIIARDVLKETEAVSITPSPLYSG